MHPSLIAACVLAGVTLVATVAMAIAGLLGTLSAPARSRCAQCHQPSPFAALSRQGRCPHCQHVLPQLTLRAHWRH